MKYLFSSIIFILVFSNVCFAKNSNLTDLDSMAKILMANIDSNQKICQLSAADSNILMNVIHAKIDDATKNWGDPKKHKEILTWDKTCQKGCHCDFYMGLLEKNLLDPQVKEAYERIKAAQLLITEKNKMNCLEKSKFLCKSMLLKELRKDAKDFAPAPGV